MAAATQVFTASDCVRYKRLHVLEKAGQRVLLYTLRCGTPYKSAPVPLDQYLDSLPQHSTARYKRMSGRERRGCFNNTDTDNISADPSWGTFDVSLLYKAITYSCEGWQDQDGLTLRLAQNVKEIKDTRNAVVHETFTTVSEQDFLTELSHLRTLLHSTLEDTKDKYNTGDSECNAIKTVIDTVIDGIQQERLSIREIQQRATADLLPSFKSEADEELRRALDRDTFIDPLHFLSQHESDRVEALKIFTPVTITENIGGSKRNVEPFKMLNHTQSGSPRLILVEGDAGSGKTTLLTYTVCEYLKEESERHMEGLHQYDLLLRVVCREETSRTLQTLLLERLLPDAFYKYGRLVMPLVRHSRVLVLVDGLDEQHDDSRHLVRDILNHGKDWPSLTLLATSRPEAVRTMKANTPPEFKVSHLLLEGVSPDRRTELALQYHEWLCADVPQSDARLRQVMEQIGWKELFRLPLNIVFVAKIVAEGSDGMIVCESELYQKILDWCVEKLKDRLLRKMRGAQDEILLDINIKYIMKQCCGVSYERLLRGKIYLSDEDVQFIAEKCYERGLPPSEILPAFYSLRRHVTQGGVTHQKYHSPHKGLQDFMAARHVMDSLSDYREGAIHRKLVNDTPGQHCDLKALRQMLRHLLGLQSQRGEAKAREMQETVSLIKDSGVRHTKDWLRLLADTKVHGQALQTVAEFINTNVHGQAFQAMAEDINTKIHGQALQTVAEDINTNVHGQELQTVAEDINTKVLRQLQTVAEDINTMVHGQALQTVAEDINTKVHGQALQTVAEYINTNSDTRVFIDDGIVSIATALLPLITTPRHIHLLLHREPREVEQLGVALHHHKLTDVWLYHHYTQPCPGAYSDHWLHHVPKSYLIHFKGHLDAEHLDLLPQGLSELDLSVSSLDHAERLIPSLANLRGKCPELIQLSVLVPVSTLGSPPSKSLPGGVARNVILEVSGVGDRDVGLACDIIAAMSPSDGRGYRNLDFPLATLTVGGWKHLIESFASRKVRVREYVGAPDNIVTKEDEEQLDSLTMAMLGCMFMRLPDCILYS